MDVRGAHVLLTGASRGIGLATAEHLAAAGARLSLVARSPGPLEAVAARLGGTAVPCDLADPQAVQGLVGRVQAQGGPVDVLVNNAGLDAAGSFLDAGAEGTAELLQVNLATPIELCRQVLPGMVERGRGQVVNVSSGYAHAATIGALVYSATKAGLTRFTGGLRMELRGTGVTASVVEPGPIATQMYDAFSASSAGPSLNRLRKLGLLAAGTPEQVAAAILTVIAGDEGRRAVPRRNGTGALLATLPERIAGALTRGLPTR